jgi:replicative DNA helicase
MEKVEKNNLSTKEQLREIEELIEDLETNEAKAELEEPTDKESYKNKYCVFNNIDSFKQNIEASDTLEPTFTGFESIDNALFSGGIPKGLLTLGAITSLGKTTFALQVADQIAQTKQTDILYFSLEMSRSELIAKSISRLTFINATKQRTRKESSTTLDIIQGKKHKYFSDTKKQLIEQSLNDYKTFAKRLFIIESVATEGIGTKEIEEAIQNHIKFTGNKPVVIIDYLQIMKTPNPRWNEKQMIDCNIVKLKRLSAEYKLLVIAISSFNRSSNTSESDLTSFKESGAIEYTSDILIGLDFYALKHLEEQEAFKELASDKEKNNRKIKQIINEAKQENPRHISLTILKNRNGKTGASADFYYYPAFNCFMEENDNGEKLSELLELSRRNLEAETKEEEENEEINDLPF